MKIPHRFIAGVLLAGSALATGCTHVLAPPTAVVTGYPTVEKSPLTAGLVLSDELRAGKWQKDSMGDTFVIPIGDNLAKNSEAMARILFTDVKVAKTAAELKSAGVAVILEPKLAYINRTQGATSFGESITSIKVEWLLTARNGRSIWTETITGESSGSTGWSSPETIIKEADDKLFQKSFGALNGVLVKDRALIEKINQEN